MHIFSNLELGGVLYRVFECEMWEMWHFINFSAVRMCIVQQEIFEFWGMGRPPKRQSKSCNNKKKKQQGFNRDFARHMSARSPLVFKRCVFNAGHYTAGGDVV